MADAEPIAAPNDTDDSSDSKPALDGGAAGALWLRSAIADGASGEASGIAADDGPTGECRALLLRLRRPPRRLRRREVIYNTLVSKIKAGETSGRGGSAP